MYTYHCKTGFWLRFEKFGDRYKAKIFSDAGEPMIELTLNYNTLRELFYKFSNMISGYTKLSAFTLPMYDPGYKTIMSAFVNNEAIHMMFSQIDIMYDRSNKITVMVLFQDIADIILNIHEMFFNDEVLVNE